MGENSYSLALGRRSGHTPPRAVVLVRGSVRWYASRHVAMVVRGDSAGAASGPGTS